MEKEIFLARIFSKASVDSAVKSGPRIFCFRGLATINNCNTTDANAHDDEKKQVPSCATYNTKASLHRQMGGSASHEPSILQIMVSRPDSAFPALQTKLSAEPILTGFFVPRLPLTGAAGSAHSISMERQRRRM